MKKRQRYSSQFKFKVALEAVKQLETSNQIASRHQLHPSQISQWKQQLLKEGYTLFERSRKGDSKKEEVLQAELYEQIGRLKMELEWLKKKSARFS